MFIVKRTSQSGGTEYLVRASTGYRWDKVARKSVHKFSTKSTASKNARQYDGTVDKF